MTTQCICLYPIRGIYGDAALGEANLQMIEIARQYGAAAKFPGSGGAVVGMCLDLQTLVSFPGSLWIQLE